MHERQPNGSLRRKLLLSFALVLVPLVAVELWLNGRVLDARRRALIEMDSSIAREVVRKAGRSMALMARVTAEQGPSAASAVVTERTASGLGRLHEALNPPESLAGSPVTGVTYIQAPSHTGGGAGAVVAPTAVTTGRSLSGLQPSDLAQLLAGMAPGTTAVRAVHAAETSLALLHRLSPDFTGTAGLVVSIDPQKWLLSLRDEPPPFSALVLLDERGRVVTHPIHDTGEAYGQGLHLGQPFAGSALWRQTRAVQANADDPPSAASTELYSDEGRILFMGALAPLADGRYPAGLSGLGWTVGVIQNVDAAMAPVTRDLSRSLLLQSILIAALLALIWWQGARLAGPIEQLAAAAGRFGARDFAHRVNVRTGDEVERLGDALNRMAAQLQQRDRSLLEHTASLQRAERDLRAALDRERLVNAIGSRVRAESNLETILQRALQELTAVLGTPRALVRLLKPPFTNLHMEHADASVPSALECYRNGGCDVLAPTVLQIGEAVAVADVRRDARYAGCAGEVTRLRTSAEAVVPVTLETETIGLLFLHHLDQPHEWSENELATARAVTAQAAIAIQQAILLDRLRMEAEQLDRAVRERTRELREAQARMARSERLSLVGEAMATLAHEVRNPLAVIRNSVYFIGQRLSTEDERVRRHLALIEENVERASRIIEDVRASIRGHHGEGQREPVDVAELVDQAISYSAASQLSVRREISRNLPMLLADQSQLLQVLINLMNNAAEAMGSRGEVTVRARQDGHQIILEVVDQGPGFAPDVRDRLFEPLFTTKPTGTGLGLALSRRIVEAHGGRIEADSNPGAGATFRIALPSGEHVEDSGDGDARGTALERDQEPVRSEAG